MNINLHYKNKLGGAMENIVEIKNVSKTYKIGEKEFKALDDVNLSIKKGELVVILGPSGAGKSTLLNLIGGMDNVTSGEIKIDGEEISKYNENELSNYRAENIGFIFQFYNILPTLTVLENVEIVKDIVKNGKDSKQAIKDVGLENHINKFPNQLSGGEQQRVSIARAIAKNPEIFVFDDSFSALDFKTDVKLRTALSEKTKDKTVIIVAQRISTILNADQIIVLDDGNIVGIGTHEELMKNNETYKEIALSQLSKEELE